MGMCPIVDTDGQHLTLEGAGDESVDEVDCVSSGDRSLDGVIGNDFEIRGTQANLKPFAELPLDLAGDIGWCAHDRRNGAHLELVAQCGDTLFLRLPVRDNDCARDGADHTDLLGKLEEPGHRVLRAGADDQQGHFRLERAKRVSLGRSPTAVLARRGCGGVKHPRMHPPQRVQNRSRNCALARLQDRDANGFTKGCRDQQSVDTVTTGELRHGQLVAHRQAATGRPLEWRQEEYQPWDMSS